MFCAPSFAWLSVRERLLDPGFLLQFYLMHQMFWNTGRNAGIIPSSLKIYNWLAVKLGWLAVFTKAIMKENERADDILLFKFVWFEELKERVPLQ